MHYVMHTFIFYLIGKYMNYEKLAINYLLEQLALKLNITVDNLINLYNACNTHYFSNTPSLTFVGLIRACLIDSYKSELETYFKDLTKPPVSENDMLVLTSYKNDAMYKYFYMYDMITVAYVGDGLFTGEHIFSGNQKVITDVYYNTDDNEPTGVDIVKVSEIIHATVDEVEEFGNLVKPIISISTTPVVWGTQQSEALAMVYKWLRTKSRQPVFRLFGWAGTGKTRCSKQVELFVNSEQGINNVPRGEVLYAAYTGKAASVLRNMGCLNATTLHSLLYRPVIDSKTGKCVSFTLNQQSPIATASLLIVDEVSMVNTEMANDILSFNCPVLVLGDPEQLPPVKGEGYFIDAKPDYMLTEIHRQAKDNPIIYLATRVRECKNLKAGTYGASVVYSYGHHVSDELFNASSQVIVGLNATRKSCNIKVRKLNGNWYKSPIFPIKGDRLICTKNNSDRTLFNGSLWTCNQPTLAKIMQPKFKNAKYKVEGTLSVLKFKVKSVDSVDNEGNRLIFDTQCAMHHFNTSLEEPNWRDLVGSDSFDYSGALTAHKSQGSSFESPLIFDESSSFGEYSKNWLYTAITRGVKKVIIQQ